MKALRAENHGHINLLPDDILIGIISRLPIRDAVVTGGVATRWRHLWKNIPSLCLLPSHINLKGEGEDPWSLSKPARLAGVVRSVLRHHCGIGVNKFWFGLPLTGCCHTAELDQVMEFVAAAGTRHLGFSLANNYCSEHAGPHYDFPHWRFTGGHLQRLFLCCVGLNMAPQRNLEGLAQLTDLNLTCVAVDDSGVANILSTCGALITLYLQQCQQLVHVNMSHARLRVFDIRKCDNLKSITIQSSTLTQLVYKGHKIDIKYSHTPAIVKLRILFCMENECPLDCVGSAGALPNLKQLFLEFPSPLHAATCTQLQGVQHNRCFGGLNRIVLLLKTPWKEHINSVAYLLVATPSVKELCVEAYSNLPTSPPNSLMIQWPERCLMKKLQSIIIGGFSGEAELMELIFFLLQRSPALRTLALDTHRRHLRPGKGWNREEAYWNREEAEDHVRCYYARGVALTNLVPKIPSSVKFTIL
jgi:hypothetical protein